MSYSLGKYKYVWCRFRNIWASKGLIEVGCEKYKGGLVYSMLIPNWQTKGMLLVETARPMSGALGVKYSTYDKCSLHTGPASKDLLTRGYGGQGCGYPRRYQNE
ncbi:hypothetical protein FKM82_013293 [Ascaphus truei]